MGLFSVYLTQSISGGIITGLAITVIEWICIMSVLCNGEEYFIWFGTGNVPLLMVWHCLLDGCHISDGRISGQWPVATGHEATGQERNSTHMSEIYVFWWS